MPPEESIISIKISGEIFQPSIQPSIQCKNLHLKDERTLQYPNLLFLSTSDPRAARQKQHSNL